MGRDILNRVYFDAAATMPLDRRVFDAMVPLWKEDFGNAGSIHREGEAAKKTLARARKSCADVLHAHADEIVFTSGGTESNNMAIMGAVLYALKKYSGDYSKMHIVTSAIEHVSVLEVCRVLEKRGARVTYVPVNEHGVVEMHEMKSAIVKDTTLVSVMFANNEIGTLQPIAEIAKHIRKVRKQEESGVYPLFHTDAAQAPVWCTLPVLKLGVDFLSIDGHKIYGPKGVGLLFVRRDIEIEPLLFGGMQEGGRRPGTEPLPLIVGLAKALEIAEIERVVSYESMFSLRQYFIQELETKVPQAKLNGDAQNCLPNIVNVSVPGMDSDFLVIALDERGIACASRSACHSNDDSSYVVAALGKGAAAAEGSLRFSMPKEATKKNVDDVVAALQEIVQETVTTK